MVLEPKLLFNHSFFVCAGGCVFTAPFVMFLFAFSFCLCKGGLKYMLFKKKKVVVVCDYIIILDIAALTTLQIVMSRHRVYEHSVKILIRSRPNQTSNECPTFCLSNLVQLIRECGIQKFHAQLSH